MKQNSRRSPTASNQKEMARDACILSVELGINIVKPRPLLRSGNFLICTVAVDYQIIEGEYVFYEEDEV